MTTKARLGIDISAVDKTGAAFNAVKSKLDGVTRAVNSMRNLMVLQKLTPWLEQGIRSLVDFAKQTAPVKAAFAGLERAWAQFAAKVGESGLNSALVNFSQRMANLIAGTDGLARSIGAFMGGAIITMAVVFEGVGRAIAFTYDNAAILARFLGAFALAAFAQRVLGVGIAFYYFAKAVRTTGIIMTAFQAVSRANLLVFLTLAAGVAYATDSVDQLKSGIEAMWNTAKQIFPMIGETVGNAMEGLGFDMSALNTQLADAYKFMDKLPSAAAPAAGATATLGKVTGQAGETIKGATGDLARFTQQAEQSEDVLGQVGDTIGSKLGETLKSFASGALKAGDAVKQFVTSALSSLSSLALSSAFRSVAGMFGGGVAPSQQGKGGGFLSSILGGIAQSFAGGFANGGTIKAGQWGIVGERGPEPVIGPATVIPNRAARQMARGTSITVNIQTPNPEAFRRSESQIRHQLASAVAAGQRYM